MVIVAPLAGLAVVALVLWVIATALAIALIVDKIGAILNGIPGVGGYLESAMKSVGQAITSVAGKLEDGIDHLIGAAWHLFARYLDHTWQQFVAHAHVLAMLAKVVGDQIYSVSGLRSLVHDLTKAWHGIEHGVKTLTREYHGIERRVKALERSIAEGIGHDLRITIKALERRVHGIEKGVIPELRAGIKAAEGEVTDLQNFIGAIPGTKYAAWAAGIVTAALGTLGLSWLRCDSNPFNNNKNACGLWSDLAGLLGLVTTVLVAEDFEQLVREMQAVEGETIGVIENLFNIG